MTILLFIAVLALLVLVHEFGHFIAAKRAGVRVDEFGFGFPPRIFGKKYKGTLYSLNWIPLGGFVKIKGVVGDDSDVNEQKTDPESFASRSFLQRFLILFAGIGMNVLLAIVLYSIVYMAGIQTVREFAEPGGSFSDPSVVVTNVLPDSTAQKSGIEAGDTILSINSSPIEKAETLQELTKQQVNTDMQLTFERNGEVRTVAVVPQILTNDGAEFVGIGIGIEELVEAQYPWYRALWLGVKTTGIIVFQIAVSLVDIFKGIFTSRVVTDDLAGPVGIAVLTGEVARLGIVPLLQFVALLSINLAIFNLLPIPALDGGRLFFVILEKIRRKPVNEKIEAVVHNVGFVLLILLVLFVTFKDISRF